MCVVIWLCRQATRKWFRSNTIRLSKKSKSIRINKNFSQLFFLNFIFIQIFRPDIFLCGYLVMSPRTVVGCNPDKTEVEASRPCGGLWKRIGRPAGPLSSFSLGIYFIPDVTTRQTKHRNTPRVVLLRRILEKRKKKKKKISKI